MGCFQISSEFYSDESETYEGRVCEQVNESAVLTGAMRRSLVLVMDKDVAGHHIAKVCL